MMLRVSLVLLALMGNVAAAPLPDNTAAVKELAEAHRNERDVTAQESMAHWTWIMALTTIAATALSGGAAFAALRSVALSRKAMLQAEKGLLQTIDTGRAQSRAYVHASIARFSSEAPDVLVDVENTGQTPATIVSVGASFKVVEIGKVQGEIDLTADFEMKSWPALGSGQKRTVQLDSNRDLIQHFRKLPSSANMRLLVVGRIDYEDIYGCRIETWFAFFVKSGETRFRLPPTARLPAYYMTQDDMAAPS